MNNIEQDRERFARLSRGRRRTLAREAERYIAAFAGCGDNGGWWRSLSARHVRELAAAGGVA